MIFGTFDVGAASYPIGAQFEKKNNVFEADDGSIRVRGIGIPRLVHTYKFKRLTDTQKNLLQLALMGSTFGDWGVEAINIVDDLGASFQGRLWASKLKFEQRQGRFWSATVVVRVEGGYPA